MSRTVARMIDGFIDIATFPLNGRNRDKTAARVADSLGRRSRRAVVSSRGRLEFYALRGAGTASAVERFHQDEPETLEWIDTYVRPGDTVWDIGANIGMYSLYAALAPGVTVYAFEPSALNFSLLVEHVALNRMGDQVKPLCLALGDATRIDQLHMGEMAVGHASNALGAAQTQFREFVPAFSQAVPAITADDLCRVFGLRAPDHIKLDVDGIEDAILAGARKTLPSVRTLVIEVEGRNAASVADAIEAPLARAGFAEDTGHREKGSGRNRLYVNKR